MTNLRSRRGRFLLLLLGGAQSCGAGWRRHADPPPGLLAPHQQVQVWRQGQVVRWHAVHLSADSVSGIPYLRPVTCDSCRLALPRGAVDSIRWGSPVAGFWKTAGLVVAVPMVFLLIACRNGCSPD